MEIQGKIGVVTGGSSGIGRAIALALAQKGANLVIADIEKERMAEVCHEIENLGQKAVSIYTDVSDYDSIQTLFDKTLDTFGRADILVNNAGVHMAGPIHMVTMDDWKWIIDINLYGVIHGVQIFTPYFMAQGSGHIVNTASMAGQVGFLDGSIPYSVTKFGVVGLSEGLAVFLGNKGIGVTLICPSLVQTNLVVKQRNTPTDSPIDEMRVNMWRRLVDRDWSEVLPNIQILAPGDVAEKTIQAIIENRFLVLTHDDGKDLILEKATDIDRMIRERIKADAALVKTLFPEETEA